MANPIETNWYVLTGGPHSGKTKTLEFLAFLGYPIIPEAARILIDSEMSQGLDIQTIRQDEKFFQRTVWDMKVVAEKRIHPARLTFFDRGLPDTLAYYWTLNSPFYLDHSQLIERRYRGIFFLDEIPDFKRDYARTESREFVDQLNQNLQAVYRNQGYDIITVPVMSINERAFYILDKITHARD